MNRKQISSFLNSVVKGVSFEFKFVSDEYCEHAPAAVENETIIINRKIFKTYKIIEQKCILLHEVGHILSGKIKNNVKSEFCAQMLAIYLAKYHNWDDIYKELDKMIRDWATDYTWREDHGYFRKYILAGRQYLCLSKR